MILPVYWFPAKTGRRQDTQYLKTEEVIFRRETAAPQNQAEPGRMPRVTF